MSTLQTWIHTLEEGKGSRIIRTLVAVLGFAFLALVYNLTSFRNFSQPEAMDVAQVARNVSQGRGFTTDYIRPLSVHLLQKHGKLVDGGAAAHPDLAHAPLYPALLAAYMKVVPFDYSISIKNYFGSYRPEMRIALLNQAMFLLAVLLVYSVGKRLFDVKVGWLAAILFGLTELFWQFSIAGLSTMLALVLFLALFRVLLRLQEFGQEMVPDSKRFVLNAVLAGLLLGLLCLTRYSLGWLLLPVLLFIGMVLPRAQVRSCAATVIIFALMVAPWLYRNHSLSGTLFGTAGYSVYGQTSAFPGDTLERSINLDKQFAKFEARDVGRKIAVNSSAAFSNLPLLGGSWLMALFLVGLLVPMELASRSMARIFVITALLMLMFAQAAGATVPADQLQGVTGDNLMVLVAPLVFVFGVGLFFTLIDRLDIIGFGVRSAIVTIFVGIISLPMIFELLPPKRFPSAYPPYNPPTIQLQIANLFKTNELLMSDIPAAVAWYGDRPCSALTLNYTDSFLRMNDDFKTINAVYFSPKTLNQPFLLGMYRPLLKKGDVSWERFALESLSKGEIPTGFPLKSARADLIPDHLLLADWDRWR